MEGEVGEGAEGLWSCAGSAVVVSQGSIPPGDLSAHSVHPGARICAGGGGRAVGSFGKGRRGRAVGARVGRAPFDRL